MWRTINVKNKCKLKNKNRFPHFLEKDHIYCASTTYKKRSLPHNGSYQLSFDTQKKQKTKHWGSLEPQCLLNILGQRNCMAVPPQWFSKLLMHWNHLEGLLKWIAESRAQSISFSWSELGQEFAFLLVPRWQRCCWLGDHTLRNILLGQPKRHSFFFHLKKVELLMLAFIL